MLVPLISFEMSSTHPKDQIHLGSNEEKQVEPLQSFHISHQFLIFLGSNIEVALHIAATLLSNCFLMSSDKALIYGITSLLWIS